MLSLQTVHPDTMELLKKLMHLQIEESKNTVRRSKG